MATNPLSPLSYTNKDFQTIYPELLDLVKELTYKWDPTVSNESDPGVLLLKLDAIIADKNNYNIDKNILEAFPETVTQEVNARNLYKQLAYRMPWYQSATTTLVMKWIGDEITEESGHVVVPKYTMVTDSENSVIYTTTRPIEFTPEVTAVTVPATQGVIVSHSVNGSETIDLSCLDYRNRLYLNDYTIAENGVFICNIDDSESLWERVDNLQVKTLGNRYYEFGVDNRNSACYVEFPDDIDQLIGTGLNIKYLLSEGNDGNIAAKVLDRFYEEASIEVNGESVSLNTDIVSLTNSSAAEDGADPQDLVSAYKSYRKTAGTFNTLVTLRDYINAVYNSGYVSNANVCDRLNDPQSSYRIVTEDSVNTVQVYQTNLESADKFGFVKVESNKVTSWDEHEYYKRYSDSTGTGFKRVTSDSEAPREVYLKYDDVKDMNAFDLKLYLLKYTGAINSNEKYNSSFELVPSEDSTTDLVIDYIENNKCISHDYKDIISNIPCMYKNVYPLKVKVIPHYKLTSIQQSQVNNSIIQALWNTINSRQIEFGEEPSYDIIYDTIQNSDERIKFVVLDDFEYTTFATYWNDSKKSFEDVPVSIDDSPYVIYIESKDDISKYTSAASSKKLSTIELTRTYFVIKNTGDVYKYNSSNYAIELLAGNQIDIQKDIFAKSVLAGVTPLYSQDNDFNYQLNHEYITEESSSSITTHLAVLPFSTGEYASNNTFDFIGEDGVNEPIGWSNPDTSESVTTCEVTLGENESIRFLAPSFITRSTYSNYVKFVMWKNESTSNYLTVVGTDDIIAGTKYYIKTKEDYDKLSSKFSSDTFEVTNDENGYGTWIINKNTDIDMVKTYLDDEDITVQEFVYSYSVNANSEYQLQSGETIVFFWRETEGDDVPYKYVKYTGIHTSQETPSVKSPIIKPSFTLHASGDKNPCPVDIVTLKSARFPDRGEIKMGDDLFNQVSALYGEYDLTGSKSIEIRDMNQITLDIDRYYYLISNKTRTDDEGTDYVMTLKKLYSTDKDPITGEILVTYTYTLANDEWFIHTDKSLSSFESLAAGTMIGVTRSYTSENDISNKIELSVSWVNAEEIANAGISVFGDYCKKPAHNDTIFCREQQIFSFVEGDTVRFALDLGSNWSIISDYGNEINDQFSGRPFFCSWADTYIKNIDIQYKVSTSTEYTKLPVINMNSEDICWSARTSLNINSKSDEAQKIVPWKTSRVSTGTGVSTNCTVIQFIILNDIMYPTNYEESESNVVLLRDTITGTSFMPPIYMASSIDLNKVGGENIDISYVNLLGERFETLIYLFSLIESFNVEPWEITTEGEIKLNYTEEYITSLTEDGNPKLSIDSVTDTVEPGTECIELTSTLKLPKNNKFLFAVKNVSQDMKFTMRATDKVGIVEQITPLNAGEYTDYLNAGTYYYLLDTNNNDEVTLVILTSRNSGTLTFNSLLKCHDNEVFELYEFNSDDIIKTIKNLDRDNLFKYDYVVDEETVIENPLQAKTFFNENHVMNPYTIAKGNIISSNFSVINNR